MIRLGVRFNRILIFFCTLVSLLVPGVTKAAVFISEVAWMGTANSANHEWIELTNDGGATSVDGWRLTDSQNLTIELSGTIPANAVVVLERSSDEAAPGAAFVIYTGALVNSGATLRLENGAGGLEDQVVGGENWQNIGGDNTTKETAQYTTAGWVTAIATPGRLDNNPVVVEKEAESEATEAETGAVSTSKSSTKSKVVTVPLVLPDITLQLAVQAQTVGYVHQTIALQAKASGIGDTLLDSLVYDWNFGDGFTGSTDQPTHSYLFPGTYVVTLKATYKRQTQFARHEITILPVKLSLTVSETGAVQVNNDSPYEVDISGYQVRGANTFTFPAHSIILPNQTITLPKKFVATSYQPMYGIYDNAGVYVAGLLPRATTPLVLSSARVSAPQSVSTSRTISAEASKPKVLAVATVAQPNANFSFASDEPVPAPATTEPVDGIRELVTQPADTPVPQNERLVYVAFCSVLLLGILAAFVTPRRQEIDRV